MEDDIVRQLVLYSVPVQTSVRSWTSEWADTHTSGMAVGGIR